MCQVILNVFTIYLQHDLEAIIAYLTNSVGFRLNKPAIFSQGNFFSNWGEALQIISDLVKK